MDNDANAAHTATTLLGLRSKNSLAEHSNEIGEGYESAIATGALDFAAGDVLSEQTPLLSRRDTYSSGQDLPAGSVAEDSSNSQNDPPIWQGEVDFADLVWYKKPSILWLLLPFLLYSLTFGGTLVPTLDVITQLLCREKIIEQISANTTSLSHTMLSIQEEPYLDPKFCNKDPEVQAAVSIFSLWTQAISGILAAFIAPKLGSLSDRYGRLRFLALTACGTLAKDAILILIFAFPLEINVRWLIAAYALDGLCGSFTTGMAITHAYASDCTPPNRRAIAFGWFHGCFFTGLAIGPVAAGYVVKLTGHVVNMFYIALAMHTFFVLFVLFAVPESLTKARQKEAREKHRQNNTEWLHGRVVNATRVYKVKRWIRRNNFLKPLNILFPTGPGTSWSLRKNMVILASIDTIMFAVAMGAMTVTIIYTKAAFDWDIVQTSTYISIVNIARVSVLLIIMPVILRVLRGKSSKISALRENGCDNVDKLVIIIAVAFDLIGFVGYATASTGAVMILAGVIASVGGMGSPMLQSSLTKHVPPDQVGQLLGATGLLHALARVVSPIACNYIYAKTVVRGMPQVVFIVLSVCFGLAFTGSLFIKKGVYFDTKAVVEESRPSNDGQTRSPALSEQEAL